MAIDPRIDPLLSHWERAREQGIPPSAEELCKDCPELLEEVRRRIAALSAMDGLLAPVEQAGMGNGPVDTPDHPPEETAPLIPGYEILEKLGQGGMGVVYKARQVALNRIVALKTIRGGTRIPTDELARFRREAKIMALLQHPNIVQVHDIGAHEGRLYIAMEYSDGGSLADQLSGMLMPLPAAAELIETLARAVHLAHERGIIHRDLKPNNVLLTASGIPKIADFGLAKRLGKPSTPSARRHTRTGIILGTPCYMPPEQALGQHRELGPAVDIYALGIILYESITGRPPFVGATVLDTLEQVKNQEPLPPRQLRSKVPRDLETICLKCLRKDPRRRYTSAEALAQDLRRFQLGEPILARPVSSWERCWRWCRRQPSQAALVIVSVLALLVLLGTAWWFNRALDRKLQETETARQVAVTAELQLEEALAREVAHRIESDLRLLASIPTTLAAALEQNPAWTDDQLDAWIREVMWQTPEIFGMCIACEPFQWDPQREDYALYVYRKTGGITRKQLLPPDYLPLYRAWDWYRIPRMQQRTVWSEPYVGAGGDRTPMVTYSVPFHRQGKFIGVVAVDLSIKYFDMLRDSLDRLNLGQDSYCLVISQKGTFIYHPDAAYQFPSKKSDLGSIPADASFSALVQRMQREESGRAEAVDFTTGKPALFQFSRVPSAGWMFVLVIPRR